MTEHAAHLFQVSVEGLFHVYYSDDQITEEQVQIILDASNPSVDAEELPRPIPARIEANIDNRDEALIWFVPDPRLPINIRARQIAASAFGWHMIFHGTVLFLGFTEEQVAHYIEEHG